MRWKLPTPDLLRHDPNTRYRWRFAVLPTLIDEHCVWLEPYWARQVIRCRWDRNFGHIEFWSFDGRIFR